MNLLRAETKRLLSRRMTLFFPLGLAALFVAGVGLAFVIITVNDNSVDFLSDIAGGDGSETLGPIAGLLPVMAFTIGASFIGADLKTGMIEQILTWEPRRLRVLAARLVAVVVTVGVIAMALAAWLIALLWLLAALTGTTDGVSGDVWANIAASLPRTGLAMGLFAAFGLGVTLLVDSSVGAIVGFLIYYFIIDGFLITLFLPRVAPYLPVTNAASFSTGAPVERVAGGENVFSSDFDGELDMVIQHGYLVAGLLLAAWTLLAAGLAAYSFSRRDIG